MGRARDLTETMLASASPGRGVGAFREIWDRRQPGLYARVGQRATVWWFRPGTGGKRIRLGVHPQMRVMDARSAASQLRGHEVKQRLGICSSHPMAPTLREGIEAFESDGCPRVGGDGALKARTWSNYRTCLFSLADDAFLDTKIPSITVQSVERQVEAADCAQGTARRGVRCLRSLFSYFIKVKKWATEDPTKGQATRTKTKRSYPTLSEAEVRAMVERFLSSRPDVRNCALLLSLASATRPTMILRLRPENFEEDGAVVKWKSDQMKMSNRCVWYPGPIFRPLVRRLVLHGAPFDAGNEERSRERLYDHHKRRGVPCAFKRAQKTGSTWMQSEATRQKEAGEGVGASMSDIGLAAEMMTAHIPQSITTAIYTGSIYEVQRPLLEKAAIVLENRIAEVTGVDFTDPAVLDVLCPKPQR